MSDVHSSGAVQAGPSSDATADQIVESSGLTSDVQAVIIATVRATRLWPRERADVARELVAHFRDGIERGESPETLIARFGEPKAAGKRIGKAAREKRSWAWHAGRRVLQGTAILLGGVVLLYGAAWIRFASGSPTITRNYAAELNAPVQRVPESARAWNVYKPAIIALQPTMRTHEGWADVIFAHPNTPEFAKAKAAADAFEPQLQSIRRGAAMQDLGYLLTDAVDPELELALNPQATPVSTPASENPMLIGVLLQPLGPMRSAGRALALQANVAAAEGDGQRATDNILAILGMARQTFDQPFLISDLVAAALGNLAWNATCQFLERYPDAFTDAHLATLKQEIAKDAGDREFFADPSTEIDFMGDTLQRIYTDDGNGDGRLTPEGLKLLSGIVDLMGQDAETPVALSLTGPAFMIASPGRRETREQYERVINHYVEFRDKPMWTWTQSPDLDATIAELKAGNRFSVAYLLTPALGRTLITGNWTRLWRQTTLAAIALEQFKRANGRYPDTLNELVPTYLATLPTDVVDGQPIRYRLVEGKPVLYSIGMDRVDNDGRPAMEGDTPARTQDWRDAATAARMVADGFPNASKFDGDVVLWPRED